MNIEEKLVKQKKKMTSEHSLEISVVLLKEKKKIIMLLTR